MSAEPSVRIVGQYRRSSDGKTIHLEPCSAKGGVPWMWADGMSLHQVVSATHAAPWLRLCRRCWPAEAIALASADMLHFWAVVGVVILVACIIGDAIARGRS